MCDSHLHAIDANTDQAVLNQRLHILGALQTATLDFSALVACILDTVTTSIPDARAVLLIADAPGAMLACAGCHGLNQTDTEAVMQLRMSLLGNTSLLHPVIAARQTAYITNAMLQAHPQRSLAMQRIATTPFWVFPLVDADHIRGVLLVDTQCTDDTIASPTIAVLDSLRFAMAQALHQTTRYREAVQASQDVEAQVLHRTHELARALAKKDEYLANMSHELRTPLTSIMSMAQSLQMGLLGPLPESQHASVDIIEESSRHLLSLINTMLDLAKIESGKMELLWEQIDIDDCCHHVTHLLSHAIREKHLRLTIQIQDGMQFIDADETRLIQMLVNLLGNAVKFTSDQGHIGIDVTGDPVAKIVKLTVWDTGIGIAPEQIPLLFEPFVQLGAQPSHQQTGSGLGLSLVRRIADMHGGSITVTSALGQGTRFTICLPWENGAAEQAGDPASGWPSTDVVTAAATVLLVEDQAVVLESVSSFLTAQGYIVETATNGVDAIERALALAPDVILLDIQMPVKDGFTVAAELRQHPITASIPIIALTAMVMPGDRERCLEAAMNAYLTKPVDFRQLRTVLRQHLGE